VLFDLYNEPIFNQGSSVGQFSPMSASAWECWRNGGCSADFYNTGQPDNTKPRAPDGSAVDLLIAKKWPMAGMQELVDSVRNTGAVQPVLLGGPTWTLDLSQWLAQLPHDPANQIAASVHLYNFSGGGFNAAWTFADWARDPAIIAQTHPVVTGELGATEPNYKFIDDYMDWADRTGVSYLLFTWVRWHEGGQEVNGGITVINNYAGEPSPMAQGFHQHLLTVGYP
jgi:hypothetical protein